MSDFVLSIDSVTKTYGDFKAVDNVSFQIPAGSIYGFLGPNGAGKTTTIRMILEIIKPSSGTISIFGKPSALDVRERIGYLPEEKGLYKKMRAWSTIAYFASLKGMDRRAAKRRAFELLERYGLKDFAEAKTDALSKGMGQKVQVLASIAHEPEFVILDEPFSGLDPVNQVVMEEVIHDIAKRGGTVLFSTHVMSHAERICDRVLIMAGGQKILDDTVDGARSCVARRVRLKSPADLSYLEDLDAVERLIQLDEPGAVDALLTAQGESLDVIQACLARGHHLERFDDSPPSLHDVFVELVGDKAKEASFR